MTWHVWRQAAKKLNSLKNIVGRDVGDRDAQFFLINLSQTLINQAFRALMSYEAPVLINYLTGTPNKAYRENGLAKQIGESIKRPCL